MKKSLFVLTAALSFGMATAQTAAPAPVAPAPTASAQVPTLSDVPAGHWAKDAIDKLVANGVLLGYPDGTFRGTQNLTRYEAAVIIARLLNQMGSGQVQLDPATLTSLQNAVQELSADLAALGVRVTDLEENAVAKDDFTRLEERVSTLEGGSKTGDAGALAQLQSQIADFSTRADDLQANYDTLRADVDDNASSIAALNDLTVLLNQDILNLQDRASALEAAQADFVTRTDFDALNTTVKGIDTRVATLENAPKFTVGGSLEAKYGSVVLTRNDAGGTNGDFDIDRLTRGTFINDYFSNDQYCPLLAPGGYASAVTRFRGNNGVRCVDTSNSLSGLTATVNFGVSNLKTANGAITINSANVSLLGNTSTATTPTTIDPTTGAVTNNPTYVTVRSADLSGSSASGVKFSVRFDNGNDSNSNFKFNDYLFANDNDVSSVIYRRGVVANIDASTLSSFGPKLTVVSGAASTQLYTKDGQSYLLSPASAALYGGYFGTRATITPMGVGTLGFSYAQGNVGTALRRDALSADADLKVGPATLQSVFVASYKNSLSTLDLNQADKAGYVKFGVDFGGLNLNANYRYIDPAYENGIAGMSSNDNAFYYGVGGYQSSAPFGPNENGYGVDGSFSVGPVKVGGYVNSFVTANTAVDPLGIGAARQTAYGVNLGTTALYGLSLTGFFNNAQLDSQRLSELYGNNTSQENFDQLSFTDPLLKNSSNFGVALKHDGSSAAALVKGLNIDAVYARFYDDNRNVQDYKYNDFRIWSSYSGKFGVLTVKPFVRYHYFNNPVGGQAVLNGGTPAVATDGSVAFYQGLSTETYTYNTIKGGLQVSTDPVDVVTKPSVFGGVSYRNTNFTGNPANPAATTELFGNVGITLNEALFENNKLSVGYSYYEGHNLGDSGYGVGLGVGYNPFSAASDRIFRGPQSGAVAPWAAQQGTTNVKLDGIYGQWEAYGLRAAYGVFRNTNLNNNQQSTAQAFKVSAKILF